MISNVICPLNTPNTNDRRSRYLGNLVLGGTQSVPAGNTDRRRLGLSYFQPGLTTSRLTTGPSMQSFVARPQ